MQVAIGGDQDVGIDLLPLPFLPREIGERGIEHPDDRKLPVAGGLGRCGPDQSFGVGIEPAAHAPRRGQVAAQPIQQAGPVVHVLCRDRPIVPKIEVGRADQARGGGRRRDLLVERPVGAAFDQMAPVAPGSAGGSAGPRCRIMVIGVPGARDDVNGRSGPW